jgi:uncharacterized membrane protein YoaK (UPF0700 family)
MNFLKSRVWTAGELICLKWSAFLAGAVAGAYLTVFVKSWVWLFVAAVVAFAIKPTWGYFRK